MLDSMEIPTWAVRVWGIITVFLCATIIFLGIILLKHNGLVEVRIRFSEHTHSYVDMY